MFTCVKCSIDCHRHLQVAEDSFQLHSQLLPAMIVQGGPSSTSGAGQGSDAAVGKVGARASEMFATPDGKESLNKKPLMSAYEVLTRRKKPAKDSVYGPLEDPWRSVGGIAYTSSVVK